jgi:hypothetical protein
MNIEDILSSWNIDSKIDITELGSESIKIPKLHHKYYSIYIDERLKLRSLETKFKQLKLEKYEFYTQGPNEETLKKGWTLPAKGMILKSDIPLYMDADKDLIDLSLKVGIQQEKIDLLDSIIKSFHARGFNIKNAIEDIKFKMGN